MITTLGFKWTDNHGTYETPWMTIKPHRFMLYPIVVCQFRCFMNRLNDGFRLDVQIDRHIESVATGQQVEDQWAVAAVTNPAHKESPDVSAFLSWITNEQAKRHSDVALFFAQQYIRSLSPMLSTFGEPANEVQSDD